MNNRAGYRKGEGDERRWYVTPEVSRSEICDGLDPSEMAKVLIDRGMMEPGEGDQQAKICLSLSCRRNVSTLSSRLSSGVNGAAIFLRSGAAKFPSLAGWRSAVCVIGASVFWRPATAFQGRRNGIGGRRAA